MLNNIVNMFPKTGSKVYQLYQSQSRNCFWITVNHNRFVSTLFAAELRVRMNNQIQFLAQFYLALSLKLLFSFYR
jgi:hypothetical protein